MLQTSFSRFSELEVSLATKNTNPTPSQVSKEPSTYIEIDPKTVNYDGRQLTDQHLVKVIENLPYDRKPVLLSQNQGVTSQRMIDVLILLSSISGIQLKLTD